MYILWQAQLTLKETCSYFPWSSYRIEGIGHPVSGLVGSKLSLGSKLLGWHRVALEMYQKYQKPQVRER